MGEPFVVDAHTHVWELDRRPQSWIEPATMSVLARDHPVDELSHELADADVGAAVLVQVLNDTDETEDYLWAAAGSPAIVGVVGWADLLDPGFAHQLDALAAHPSGTALVGIRHQALAEPDPAGWLRRASSGNALRELGERGLVFDLMFRPEHLDVVAETASRHLGTAFVLDHAGKPPIADGWCSTTAQEWASRTRVLARHENLFCKLSGLTTMADVQQWTVADLAPYVEHLLATFGAQRLIFGSDWPVSLRAGSYRQTLSAVRELVVGLTPSEQAAILGANARRVYAWGSLG